MKFFILVAIVLTVHASVAASQQDNVQCYQCRNLIGEEDTSNCIDPGPSTPKGTCGGGQACWTEFGSAELVRSCAEANDRVGTAWINKNLYYGKTLYSRATSCRSSLCNNAPYAVPKYGKQVTCYKMSKLLFNPVNSFAELCAQETGGRCKTETCFGACYTRVSKDTGRYPIIDLHCEPRPCHSGCCESDLCNNDITVTKKIERPPISCYTCDDLQNSNCLQACASGSCSVTLRIEANGTVSQNKRECRANWTDSSPDPYYNSTSSMDNLYIYRTSPKEFKSLTKNCYTDRCNSNIDIPDTYASIEEESKSGDGTSKSSGSPFTSVRPPAETVTQDFEIHLIFSAGTRVHASRLNVLPLLCTIAIILMMMMGG